MALICITVPGIDIVAADFLCAIMIDAFSVFVFLYGLPETLSMKGLTLNCMDRKSEAYDLVRLGLKVRRIPSYCTFLTRLTFECHIILF